MSSRDNLKQAIEEMPGKLEGMKCPNPELMGLFREECGHPDSAWRDTGDTGFSQVFCPDCGVEWNPTPKNLHHPPQGYITRLDLATTEGALAGAIFHVTKGWPFWDKEGERIWGADSPNLAAVLALKEAVNAN